MKRLLLPSLFLIAIIISSCSGVSPEFRTFEQQVQEEIPNMIWMLEQDKRAEFVQKYISPASVEHHGGLLQVSNEFSPEAAETLIKFLKLAQETTPTIDRTSLTVTFDGTDFPAPLTFRKEAGMWKILN